MANVEQVLQHVLWPNAQSTIAGHPHWHAGQQLWVWCFYPSVLLVGFSIHPLCTTGKAILQDAQSTQSGMDYDVVGNASFHFEE